MTWILVSQGTFVYHVLDTTAKVLFTQFQSNAPFHRSFFISPVMYCVYRVAFKKLLNFNNSKTDPWLVLKFGWWEVQWVFLISMKALTT